MPHLTWPSKTPPKPILAELVLEGLVYPGGWGYPGQSPDNHLIYGDNLAAMGALLPEFEGQIDLIYADPPFFTNRHFTARVGRGEDSRKPQGWQLADGYADAWANIDDYLDMLYPRLALMHRLLAPNGTLYLHLDWHADAYARLLLDEIFGSERFLNEIIWAYHGPSPIRSAFNRKHDTILVYTKSDQYTFNVDAVRQPYNPATVQTFASSPKAGFGKVPDLARGKVPEDWWYFPVVARLHNERTGYPTQKPQALLKRIILASSNPGSLVADFFSGSGTTLVAAAQSGRRFIGVDATWRAIQTSIRRLVTAAPQAPFTLQYVDGGHKPVVALRRIWHGVQHKPGSLELDLSQFPGLVYWEIDPAWDGQVFRSAWQAALPLRRGEIPANLTLPDPLPGRLCARMTLVDGERLTWYEE
jgi:DNA modification methylase